MTSNRATRASDQDRERTAIVLGGHYAVGRLALEEFQERLDLAYAAKTLGELDRLTEDLPQVDLDRLPGARLRQPGGSPPLPGQLAPGPVQAPGRSRYVVLPLWLVITIGAFMILMISGEGGGAWVVWALVLLAFIALRRRNSSRARRTREHDDSHQLRP
jgi:hypothetical protein